MQYCEDIYKSLKTFCDPLSQYFKIELFKYMKIYKDSSYILLANDLTLAKTYFQTITNDSFLHHRFLSICEKNQLYLWPQKPLNKSMELNMDAGYWHGLSIITHYHEYLEIVDFAPHKNHQITAAMYLTSHKILEKFIEYFKILFLPKIHHVEINRTKLTEGFSFPHQDKEIAFDLKGFINSTGMNSTISVHGNIVYLTPREIQCLKLINDSYSIKTISHKLSISTRTAQEYLDNLRKKTGLFHKHDLVSVYREYLKYHYHL